METFINNLRYTLNHLSNSDHAAFHKEIQAACIRCFGGINDMQIEDWIHTEELHTKDFGKPTSSDIDPELADFMLSDEDKRADTDRTLFGTIQYIQENHRYETNLEQFRSEIEPKLGLQPTTPNYSIDTIDSMPYDAVHLFHVFFGRRLYMYEHIIRRHKIHDPSLLQNYIFASRQMQGYYMFGGSLFSDAVKDCNRLIKEIHRSFSSYIKRARSKTCPRYTNTVPLLQTIDHILSSL